MEVIPKNVDPERLFTGAFSNDDMHVALQSISIPFNLSFHLENDKVVLTGDTP